MIKTLVRGMMVSPLTLCLAWGAEKMAQNSTPIKHLPKVLIEHITTYLPNKDTCSLLSTCKEMLSVDKKEGFWERRISDPEMKKEIQSINDGNMSLHPIKLLCKYQDLLTKLRDHLKISVNIPERGTMHVESTLPQAEIKALSDKVKLSDRQFLPPSCQWTLWCTRLPELIQSREVNGWIKTDPMIEQWREDLKNLAPLHIQAGFCFVMLNQTIMGKEYFTFIYTASDQTLPLKLELRPWLGPISELKLEKECFQRAISHKVPTANFEYGYYQKPIFDNKPSDRCAYHYKEALRETDNWSSQAAKKKLKKFDD